MDILGIWLFSGFFCLFGMRIINKFLPNFYKKHEDVIRLSVAQLGIILFVIYGIFSYNQTGMWFP